MERKKKWDEMTEEERDTYVNQDVVEIDPNHEVLMCDLKGYNIRRQIERHGINGFADMSHVGDGEVNEAFSDVLTLLECYCVVNFFINKHTYKEIAEGLEMAHYKKANGDVIFSQSIKARSIKYIVDTAKGKLSKLSESII